jgi:hypothetical protein
MYQYKARASFAMENIINWPQMWVEPFHWCYENLLIYIDHLYTYVLNVTPKMYVGKLQEFFQKFE